MKLILFPAICLITHLAAGYHPPAPERLATAFRGANCAAARPGDTPNSCGDLLQKYATKPAGLVFLGCTKGEANSQTVAVATYRVSGAKAADAEKFFHEKYGMGKLKFVCCGWEPAGKHGQVTSAGLKKRNPNYSLLLAMYADERALSSDRSKWRDKSKVKYFTVEVEIVEI